MGYWWQHVKVRRVLVLLAAGVVAVLAVGGTARAAQRQSLVHLDFHHVGPAVFVSTDGRYVDYAPRSNIGPGIPPTPATLVDEQSGRRSTLPGFDVLRGRSWVSSPSQCSWSPQGTCHLHLYSLLYGGSRDVTITDRTCRPEGFSCDIVAIGSQWLQMVKQCYHCKDEYVFQNIWSGAVRSTPTLDAHDVLDLDAASLTRRPCSPLRENPPESLAPIPGYGLIGGNLSIDNFDVFELSGAPIGPYVVAEPRQYGGAQYLERCGSRLHYKIPFYAQTANRKVVLQGTGARTWELRGMFLRSRHQFRFALPSRLKRARSSDYPHGGLAYVLLSSRSLWIISADYQLWRARLPRAMSKN